MSLQIFQIILLKVHFKDFIEQNCMMLEDRGTKCHILKNA